MIRSGTFLALLALPLLATGCAATYAQGGYAHRDTRYDTPVTSRYYHRVERDVRGYIRHLDRHLRLHRRQERHLHQMLTTRVFNRLDRSHRAEHDRVYPFPRTYGNRGNNTRWWRETDRIIERTLNHRQARAYRALTRHDYDRGSYYYDRGSYYDDDDDDGDDRYERRRDRDRYKRRHDDDDDD